MKIEHVEQGIRTHISRQKLIKTMFCMGFAMLGSAMAVAVAPSQSHAQTTTAYCGEYDPTVTYPNLPTSPVADIVGEAGYELYLTPSEAVVDLDGCLYRVDRPINVDFAGLDFVTVLVELRGVSRGATVFVTEDGEWVDTIEVGTTAMFSYTFMPDRNLGFEIAATGQAIPTKPTVINRPTGGNPD